MPSEFDSYKWITPKKKTKLLYCIFKNTGQAVNLINNLLLISIYSSFTTFLYFKICQEKQDNLNMNTTFFFFKDKVQQ